MTVKGLELPAYDPRGAYGMALGYAVSTRGGCHLRAYPISHEILRKPVATDRFSFAGKARIVKISEDINAAVDSLTACKFLFFAASLEEFAKAFEGVTGVPAAVAIPFFARPLMVLVCGEKYARSAGCLQVLGLAMAVIFLTYPHLSLLVASGRQHLFAWIAGLSGLFNLGLNLVLIPRFSYMGAAWATVVTEALVLAAAFACVRRFTGLSAFTGEAVKIPLAAGATALVSFFLLGRPLWVALPLLAVVYIGILFVLRLLPFDMHDEARS